MILNSDTELLLKLDEGLTEDEKLRLKNALSHLVEALNKELKGNLKSVIVHGSLCAGDFDYQSSDVDILVLTENVLSKQDFYIISHLHNSMKRHYPEWAERFEASYITVAQFYTLAPPAEPRVYVNNGLAQLEPYGAEWYFEKHTISTSGLAIYGDSFDRGKLAVTSTKLRIAAFQILMEWWKPIVDRGMHSLSDHYLAYGVLSMCRIIMTIESGQTGSKIEAAEYVLEQYPSVHNEVIKNVMKSREHNGFERNKAIGFIRETVNRYLAEYT